MKEINIFQKQFQAKDNDIIVASFPKSGTTWLKAIAFAIVNRQCFSSIHNHPLLSSNPHQLVPYIEFMYPANSHFPTTEPRLLGTHIPFPSLSKSIIDSNCKIIYICRNPFDTFISAWHFFNKVRQYCSSSALTIEEAFEMYCNGIIEFGPWWSHMLGYWKESIVRPNKILILKYEDIKENVNLYVKRVAEFLDFPFTQEEESNGVIESIIRLCSFEKMKDLEVNKSGIVYDGLENKHYFRKAEIGGWVNYFSPSMTEKLSKIMEEKLSGSGLSFKIMHS
ncbi:cytosolic sulfotransferase 15 [Vigna radiata var. radiata]|uniref:Sulfotransferase n=1 Tax=Vigna radiata var. radiata TaxID=3916 RepID=A0A3Q0FEP0_VIGRR|nr:cytosolic sulfotransferase 15 [Vigna radiata var. radiata]XP_022641100.1 cytosolic sulfotransferase 15 [Vigna radiata var. radiata]